MPKTLADARLKVTALTTLPTAPEAAAAADLQAGEDIQCFILKSDYRLSPVASDTVDGAVLCAEGNAITYGASNYEGSITAIRYLDATGAPDPVEDIVWDLVQDKGTTLYLAVREGPRHDVDWAAGDEYELYEVMTDTPQQPADRAGLIRRIVPLGVQNRWVGTVAAA